MQIDNCICVQSRAGVSLRQFYAAAPLQNVKSHAWPLVSCCTNKYPRKKVYTPWIITSGPRDGNTVNTGLTFCVSRKAGRLASVDMCVDMSHCSLSCLSCISSDPGISHGLSEAEEQLHTALRSPLRGRCALPGQPADSWPRPDGCWPLSVPSSPPGHQPHTGPWLVTRSSPPHLRHP